ncbi:MAG: NUDIX hydrolase [Campylobacteraceae bacterium]|nr:NUDIX hydrolase [Campylobacteraceae bacterium]
MDNTIKIINETDVENSKYIKLFRINYLKDGEVFEWDCARIHDSVSVLLYDEEKELFLLVKQLRVPFLYRQLKEGISLNTQELGHTYELCSGLMDKGLSEEETIKEEIFEEVGYRVVDVEKIATFYGGLGTSASKQTFFYAKIADYMKVGKGGGIDNEDIELFYLPLKDAKEFIYDESFVKPASLAYCFMWWFDKFGR